MTGCGKNTRLEYDYGSGKTRDWSMTVSVEKHEIRAWMCVREKKGGGGVQKLFYAESHEKSIYHDYKSRLLSTRILETR